MVNLSVVLEEKTLEKIKEIQAKEGIFSRSEVVRILLNKGLEQIEDD